MSVPQLQRHIVRNIIKIIMYRNYILKNYNHMNYKKIEKLQLVYFYTEERVKNEYTCHIHK